MIVSNGRKCSTNEVWKYKEYVIENVKNFEYLGIMLSCNGSWNDHIERMIMKAKRVLMNVRKYVYKFENFPVNVVVKMCNALVLPILTYGSEIWVGNSCKYNKLFKNINVVIHNFYKEILCVPRSTPNSAVNIELGTRSVEYLCIQKAINYCNRLIKSNKRLQITCMNQGTLGLLNELLNERGLNDLNELSDRLCTKRVIHQLALTEDMKDIRLKESLSMFSMLEHYKQGARYLSAAKRSERWVIAGFRMYGFRWSSKKVNGVRECVLCDAVESVKHLIEDCPGTAGEERQDLNNIQLFTASDILNVSDTEHIPLIAAYLSSILKKRELNL